MSSSDRVEFHAKPVMLNIYQRMIKGVAVDLYDILDAYSVADNPTAHSIKKCMMAGQRGSKGRLQDLLEARQALDRAIEMEESRR